jgi:hypothetical protein
MDLIVIHKGLFPRFEEEFLRMSKESVGCRGLIVKANARDRGVGGVHLRVPEAFVYFAKACKDIKILLGM